MNRIQQAMFAKSRFATLGCIVVSYAIVACTMAMPENATGRGSIQRRLSCLDDNIDISNYATPEHFQSLSSMDTLLGLRNFEPISKMEFIRMLDSAYFSGACVDIVPVLQECLFKGFLKRAGISRWHFSYGSVNYNTVGRKDNILQAITHDDENAPRQNILFSIGRIEHDWLQSLLFRSEIKKVRYYSSQNSPSMLVQIVEYDKVIDRAQHLPFLYPRLLCTIDLSCGSRMAIIDYQNSDPTKLSGVGISRLLDACASLKVKLRTYRSTAGIEDEQGVVRLRDDVSVRDSIVPEIESARSKLEIRGGSRDIAKDSPVIFLTCIAQTLFPYASVKGVTYRTKIKGTTSILDGRVRLLTSGSEIQCNYYEYRPKEKAHFRGWHGLDMEEAEVIREKRINPSSVMRLIRYKRTSKGDDPPSLIVIEINGAMIKIRAHYSTLLLVFDYIAFSPDILREIRSVRSGKKAACSSCHPY